MTHTLFSQPHGTNKGPFIATQRLLFLQAPASKRRLCLNPARFRAGRSRKRKAGLQAALAKDDSLPPGCRWRRVKNREAFLAKLTRPRLCLLVDAGVGKTTAMQQTLYLRSVTSPGHLAMGFRFSDLPDEASEFLDQGDRSWLPLRLCDRPQQGATVPVAVARTLILRKIREGQFTLLVDALDQSRSILDSGRDPHRMAKALDGFLRRYPQVRCVVSGRPYSIHRYWSDLFERDDWNFVQIGSFTAEEQESYVGPARWEKMRQLEADVIAVPRMLETVIKLQPEELLGVRTGADLYWRALEESLRDGLAHQNLDGVDRDEALRVFSLVAIEMHQADNFEGVPSGQFRKFVQDTWQKRKHALKGEFTDWRDLKKWLKRLGRINEVLDFAVLEDSGDQQLYFRDRTLQDFFAALWLSRYAEPNDCRWLREHLHLSGEFDEHHQEEQRYPFWKLLTEMPVAARTADDTWVRAAAVLFLPDRSTGSTPFPAVRSTEMMYRAWWGLLESAGKLRQRKRPPTETDVLRISMNWQRRVYHKVEHDVLRFDANQRLPDDPTRAARHVIEQYLAEFPSIRLGRHQPAVLPLSQEQRRSAQEIAAEFDAEWFPVEIPSGPFLMGDASSGYSDEPEHEGVIWHPYRLAKHPVTNELYGLFDPRHAERFNDYSDFSGHARCPAIFVNFFDAWMASLWLHGCLPDEYQWERACRGSQAATRRTKWWYGDDEHRLVTYAWYDDNSENETHAVDDKYVEGLTLKEPNDLELYHLHGNVNEWTSSWYDDDPRKARRPGYRGWSRVLRGGSWGDAAIYCRCTDRFHREPGVASLDSGFRVSRVSRRS